MDSLWSLTSWTLSIVPWEAKIIFGDDKLHAWNSSPTKIKVWELKDKFDRSVFTFAVRWIEGSVCGADEKHSKHYIRNFESILTAYSNAITSFDPILLKARSHSNAFVKELWCGNILSCHPVDLQSIFKFKSVHFWNIFILLTSNTLSPCRFNRLYKNSPNEFAFSQVYVIGPPYIVLPEFEGIVLNNAFVGCALIESNWSSVIKLCRKTVCRVKWWQNVAYDKICFSIAINFSCLFLNKHSW